MLNWRRRRPKRYTVSVIETVQQQCEYVVEADTEDEAVRMAERGETIREQADRTLGVISRYAENATEMNDD